MHRRRRQDRRHLLTSRVVQWRRRLVEGRSLAAVPATPCCRRSIRTARVGGRCCAAGSWTATTDSTFIANVASCAGAAGYGYRRHDCGSALGRGPAEAPAGEAPRPPDPRCPDSSCRWPGSATAHPGEHHDSAQDGGHKAADRLPLRCGAEEQQEHAEGNVAAPDGTRRRGTTPSGRRPARAASTGTRLAEAGGNEGGDGGGRGPGGDDHDEVERNESVRREHRSVDLLDRRPGNSRATTAAATPSTEPTSRSSHPAVASERRTNRSGAPLAESCPTVTSWRRALVANAAEMMMPVAARAMAPATQPQASAPLCESALLSCPARTHVGRTVDRRVDARRSRRDPGRPRRCPRPRHRREVDQRDAVEHTVDELVHRQVGHDHRQLVEVRFDTTGSGDGPRPRRVGERDGVPDVDAEPIGERTGEPHLSRPRQAAVCDGDRARDGALDRDPRWRRR